MSRRLTTTRQPPGTPRTRSALTSPSDRVHCPVSPPLVAPQLYDGHPGTPHIQNLHRLFSHSKHPQVMLLLLPKLYPHQRFVPGILVQDGRMFQSPQVESPKRPVGTDADEYVGRMGKKGDVVNGSVVSDKLSQSGGGVDIPEGAGGVYGRGDEEVGRVVGP